MISIILIHAQFLCNHEEADTRMLVHVEGALDNGTVTCLVCTVDTNVGLENYWRDTLLLIYG